MKQNGSTQESSSAAAAILFMGGRMNRENQRQTRERLRLIYLLGRRGGRKNPEIEKRGKESRK